MATQVSLATAEDIAALTAEIRELRRQLAGSTITPPPRWVSVPDAARHFGVHRGTIARWIDAGKIEARGSVRRREVLLPSYHGD
ncbi:helix-turn-helix domain-containing protein [Marinibacterium profundimaris]|uniref:Helix-turn-helix domain-containing protein n=1 Tax=Marinibacterium profundimaris TaxID=1679460 RepID=A0A225NWK3_9RHOB|nr:helix-turn-helix domain-containing protein [Marinibacterium profundimaris]OWU77628.1 hypothetical protein ATO3_02805 [Marinibacterium profundimaris]